MITYEYPFNERIRTLLRLEDLFEKTGHFLEHDGAPEHHVALVTIFEILEISGRADLKMDLIQELERQRQMLVSFRNNPAISEEALSDALYEIETAAASLRNMAGRLGQYLRDNEWLMSVKSRAAIPGGLCEFDLPSYHHWLHKSPEVRRQAIVEWLTPMIPLRDALVIVLRLLRSNGRIDQQVAKNGTYQLTLSGNTAQMVRVTIGDDELCVPEISANRYALNIRFTAPDGDVRPRLCDKDVEFEMMICSL